MTGISSQSDGLFWRTPCSCVWPRVTSNVACLLPQSRGFLIAGPARFQDVCCAVAVGDAGVSPLIERGPARSL
jgi:hypothetical protein